MFKTRICLATLATFPKSPEEIAVPFKLSLLNDWKNRSGTFF